MNRRIPQTEKLNKKRPVFYIQLPLAYSFHFRVRILLVFSVLIIFFFGCSSTVKYAASAERYSSDSAMIGIASYYGKQFNGRKTANGEVFDMYSYTAAHRELPFNTRVRVTNLDNGRSVVVRINDRGPFHADRIIDLSYQAASDLRMISTGVAKVKLQVVN